MSPTPSRADSRRELDSLINSLVGDSRPGSAGPRDPSSPAGGRGSRPTSVISAGQLSQDTVDPISPGPNIPTPAAAPQPLSIAPLTTVYEAPSSPRPEVITYSKGVQTSEAWSPPRRKSVGSDHEEEWSPTRVKTPRANKRFSRKERGRDEELRSNIRKEIEEELKALQQSGPDSLVADGASSQQKFSARTLTNEELNAVTSSEEFFDFVERSTKVIERALELDQEYDVLADYAQGSLHDMDDEDDEPGTTKGKKGRRVREIAQFWDERWSKKRMISDIGFSPKVCCVRVAEQTFLTK